MRRRVSRSRDLPLRPLYDRGVVSWPRRSHFVARVVDFKNVSTVGLEPSPVAEALAGLRANEARYFKNKYDHDFALEPAGKAKRTVAWVHRILKEERNIVIE